MLVLEDADVQRLLNPAVAIAAVRESLIAHHTGGLTAPPRLHAPLGDGDLVFTVGRLAGTGYGFRVYRMTSSASGGRLAGDQLTVVFDDATGKLSGVVIGTFLGAARTGAIGAVAVDVLARPDAGTVGLIGSGRQAWTQLWAIRAVRSLRAVRVYSPDPARRDAFAGRATAELGVPTAAAETAAAAIDGADIVILATSSSQPVIEASWVAPGTHVSTLGPKAAGAHECPPELADRAGVILTDSPGPARCLSRAAVPHRGRPAAGRRPWRRGRGRRATPGNQRRDHVVPVGGAGRNRGRGRRRAAAREPVRTGYRARKAWAMAASALSSRGLRSPRSSDSQDMKPA